MLTKFIHKHISLAKYDILEDGTFYGEIPGFRGVWANAKTLSLCREELAEIFEEWLLIKIKHGEKIVGFKFGENYKLTQYA